MAREVIEKALCDFCGSGVDVKSFTLTSEGKTAVVDLCAKDGEPFDRALEVGSTRPRRHTAATAHRVPAHRVAAFDFTPPGS